jgi:uncharacterized protein (DUF2236 family)
MHGIDEWLGGRRPPHPVAPVVALAPAGLPGVRGGVQRALRRIFGERSAIADADPDPGLCGPDSPSWRIIAEPAAIAGGVRALVLQTLHPLAMAGVAAHSRYRRDPLARLRSTSDWVTISTFGTTAQVLEAARKVRRAHRAVHGTAPDGRHYRASAPELLTWVSVALTSSFLAADRLWAPRPVAAADADAFVAEQSRLAALLDERVDIDALRHDPDAAVLLRAGRVDLPLLSALPHSVADLIATLDGFAPDLRGGAQARDAVRFLRWPPLPATVRVAYLPLFAGAVGALAARHRRLLGLPTGGIAAAAAVANTATVLGALRSASGPSPAYLAARRRVTPVDHTSPGTGHVQYVGSPRT